MGFFAIDTLQIDFGIEPSTCAKFDREKARLSATNIFIRSYVDPDLAQCHGCGDENRIYTSFRLDTLGFHATRLWSDRKRRTIATLFILIFEEHLIL